MKQRLPLVLSATALAIAVFGSTPLGNAVVNALPANSVGTKQLKNKAVTGAKLKPGAVTSTHVLDGSLLAADFKAGQLPTGMQGPQGAQGPAGPQGPKGDPGTAGGSGVSGIERVVAFSANDSTSPKLVDAVCPAGKKAIGGGHQLGGAGEGNIVTYYSWAWDDLTRWRAYAKWPSGVFPQNWQLVAVAVCANAA